MVISESTLSSGGGSYSITDTTDDDRDDDTVVDTALDTAGDMIETTSTVAGGGDGSGGSDGEESALGTPLPSDEEVASRWEAITSDADDGPSVTHNGETTAVQTWAVLGGLGLAAAIAIWVIL